MKKKTVFVGIDVSKRTLDICELIEGKRLFKQINNSSKGIKLYLSGLDLDETIIAMENTGRYNWTLYEELESSEAEVYVIAPLHLKQSIGMVRGKDDQIDAYRIAWYIEKHHKDLKPWEADDNSIRNLKILLSERRHLVDQKKQIQCLHKDRYLITDVSCRKTFERRDKRRMKALDKDIKEIENQIKLLIKLYKPLAKQVELIESVPGVGKILCWNLLAKTNGFKTITEPRKLACYAGVAPFEYQSGTSLKRRPGVSNFADKQLKTLLHMSAMVALQHDPEIKQYYERKVSEGKNKMSIINAIRNKIVHRVCAVVREQRIFEKRLVVS